jgi:hypothetical protein
MTGSVNGKRGVLSFLFKESFCAARSAATVLLSGAFRTVIVYSASTTSTAQSCGMREMTTLIQNDRLKMITIWLIAEKGYFKPLFSHRFHSGSDFALYLSIRRYSISFFPRYNGSR